MSGRKAFAIAFAGIAVLGGAAYLLERERRQHISGAIGDYFGPGGLALPFFTRSYSPSIRPAQAGPYQNPERKV